MPPRLRNGSPVAQRHFKPPNVLHWCECSQCSDTQLSNSESEGNKGRWLTKRQLEVHRRDELRLQIAQEHLLSYGQVERPPISEARHPIPSELASDFDKPRMDNLHGTTEAIVNPTPPPAKSRRERRSKENVAGPGFQQRLPSRSKETLQLQNVSNYLGILTSQAFLAQLQKEPLVFIPTTFQQALTDDYLPDPNACQLDPLHSSNYTFLNIETSLSDSLRLLEQERLRQVHKAGYLTRIQKLISQVQTELDHAYQIRRKCWMEQKRIIEMEGKRAINTGKYFTSPLKSMEPMTCLVYLLTCVLHFFSHASVHSTGFLLPSLALLLQLSLKNSNDPEHSTVPSSIPADIRPVVTALQIDPVYKSMVCCPSCFQTYYFDSKDSSSWPEFCTYRSTPLSKPCGRRLQTKDKMPTAPTRQFFYQDLAHWVAGMYARPEIEQFLDKAPMENPVDGEMHDIWDGSVLRNFLGPDGHKFTQKASDHDSTQNPNPNDLHGFDSAPKINPDNEGRLIFGLNMDGFNPYLNKEAGKRVSISGMYLVCFNLPPAIRYRPENIFLLGIVPGPSEPSTHQVNHVLRPLVDQLLKLWYTGVYLTRTSLYPRGRAVRCALVPVICDLPAARRVAGLGSHNSGHFCSECLLQSDDINELDSSKWTPRDYVNHCARAREWRDAATERDRETAFERHGIRWSELLRLPYWDPTKFVVIDPMHGFYLRLFSRHIRDVWGMHITFEDGENVPELNLSEDDISQAQRIFRSGSDNAIKELRRVQLQYLCRDAGLHYGGTRARLSKSLLAHRESQGWLVNNTPANVTGNIILPPEPSSSPTLVPTSSTSMSYMQHTSSHDECEKNDQSAADSDVFDNQPSLRLLFNGPKSGLKKATKDELIRIVALKKGGTLEKYRSLYKKDLLAQIYAIRIEDGIKTGKSTMRPSRVDELASPTHGQPTTQISSEVPEAEAIPTIEQQQALQVYQTGSNSALKRLHKALLLVLCAVKLKGRPIPDFVKPTESSEHQEYVEPNYDDLTKQELVDLLLEERRVEGIINEDGILVGKPSKKKIAMLGRATLAAIRSDIAKTSLPSHQTPSPRHPGDPKWGKFKAHEWKTFCTIILPMTLTRLWGSKPKHDRQYKMLENYLHLVTAVELANKHVITENDILLYEHHMKLYAAEFLQLYPYANLSPYQHLSLHFSTHLRRFGPTHSWRCFAFERYNGLIQDIPTNHIFGKMEESKFLRFCRAQNLRALFSDSQLPEELYPVINIFNRAYGQLKISGIEDLDDNLDVDKDVYLEGRLWMRKKLSHSVPSSLGEEHIACFERWLSANVGASKANGFVENDHTLGSFVSRFGRRFEANEGPNSNIIYRKNGSILSAGKLVSIFSYTFEERGIMATYVFTTVREYQPLGLVDKANDNLQFLPPAAGFLTYNALQDDLDLVPFNDIESHFVASEIQGDCLQMDCGLLHVIPLF